MAPALLWPAICAVLAEAALKDLVLLHEHDNKMVDIHRLFRSLRQSGSHAEVVLLSTTVATTEPAWGDPSHLRLQELRSIVEYYPPAQLLFQDHAKATHWCRGCAPASYRFELQREFLAREFHSYRTVLLADVESTIFQSDPFALLSQLDFAVVAAASSCCGRECSEGAVLGKSRAIADLLQLVVEKMTSSQNRDGRQALLRVLGLE